MNRINEIEALLGMCDRVDAALYSEPADIDKEKYYEFIDNAVETVRALLPVVKAADELSACASALKRYELDGKDPFIYWETYYTALYAANKRYQAALAALEKPVDTDSSSDKV